MNKIYAFRSRREDGTISHHGIVSAVDMNDLYWGLDEMLDPYDVEIKIISCIGICFLSQNLDVDDEDGTLNWIIPAEKEELELSEMLIIQLSEEDGWHYPEYDDTRE